MDVLSTREARLGSGHTAGLEALRAKVRRATSGRDLAGAVAVLMPHARVGALPERDLAELVGWFVELRRYDELVALCRDRLGAFARRSDAEPLARFAADALADTGAHEHALAVAQVAYRRLNIPYHAYDSACHLAILKRPEEAVRWLQHAVHAGLDSGHTLLTDPALDPLRTRTDFIELVERSGAAKASAGRGEYRGRR